MKCKLCGSPKQKVGPWEFYDCGCDFAPSIQLCHNEMGEEE